MSGEAHPCRVIGIGNPDRGDDGAGRAVARWLEDHLPPGIEVIELDGEASALLAALDGVAAVYLVDTCVSSAAAGSVRRFDVATAPLPQEAFSLSTHGLGLAEAVELARALEALPPRCIVYAIEGADFEAGMPLSPPVAAAIAEVGTLVLDEIACEHQSEIGGVERLAGAVKTG